MQLAEYLHDAKISIAAFARQIGEAQATVSRYVNGKRIPQPAKMTKIMQATNGRVTPNDFYGEPTQAAE